MRRRNPVNPVAQAVLDNYGEIGPPWWNNAPVFLVGGGPSAKWFDFERVADQPYVVGVNDGALHLDTPICFSLDNVWVERRAKTPPRHCDLTLANYAGEKFLAMPVGFDVRQLDILPPVTYLERRRGNHLSDNPRSVNGIHSGWGALNLAFLKRAKHIYLIGYDFIATQPWHWFPEYSWQSQLNHRNLPKWAKTFDGTVPQLQADGVKVVNLNHDSAVHCFEFGDL